MKRIMILFLAMTMCGCVSMRTYKKDTQEMKNHINGIEEVVNKLLVHHIAEHGK